MSKSREEEYVYMNFWSFLTKCFLHNDGTVLGTCIIIVVMIVAVGLSTTHILTAKYESSAKVAEIQALADHPEIRTERAKERKELQETIQKILDNNATTQQLSRNDVSTLIHLLEGLAE